MKAKDVFLFMLSALLLFGVYSNFTPAIVITYVMYAIVVICLLLALYAMNSEVKDIDDTISLAKKKLTAARLLFNTVWFGVTAYVLYISNNFNLLWTFVFVQALTYTFIFKLFTTEGKSE